jgi:hypothetical protein
MVQKEDDGNNNNVRALEANPSRITQAAIDKAIEASAGILTARIDGVEKGIVSFQADLVRVPTTVDRAVGGLRDLFEARLQSIINHMDSLKELTISKSDSRFLIITTRLDAMDKAIELLQASTDKTPDFVREQVAQLRALTDEKFESVSNDLVERDKRTQQSLDGIGTQFGERDKRTEQLSLADKTAIAAALQAQKEAAGATNESNGAALAKMENNFTKQIEAGQVLVQSVSRNLEDKLNDLKSRMDRGEGQGSMNRQNRDDQRYVVTDKRGEMFGIIGIMIAIAAVVATIATHFTGH